MSLNGDRLLKMLESKSHASVMSALKSIRSQPITSSLLKEHRLFSAVVKHLNTSSEEVLNIVLSIAANLCLNDGHRDVFVKGNGVHFLIAILRKQHLHFKKENFKDGSDQELSDEHCKISPVNHSILCRAWRLTSNLAKSAKICVELFKNGLQVLILEYMEVTEFLSSETNSMLIRTIKKCLSHDCARDILATEKLTKALHGCLNSSDEANVNRTLENIRVIAPRISHRVEGEFVKKLVDLHNQRISRNGEISRLPIRALASIVIHSTSLNVIEGTGVTQVFGKHVQEESSDVDEVVVDAFCALCNIGAVRNYIKNNGLIPKLISLCRYSKLISPSRLITTFILFQYDRDSIEIMVNVQDFVNYLVFNTDLQPSVQLLQIFARLSQPIPALVAHENIEILLKSKISHPLLATVGKCNAYFETLLLSGRVWALSDAGCPLYEVATTGYGEGIIQRHLAADSPFFRRRVVALALPFLIPPERDDLVKKLTENYTAMSEILTSLCEEFKDPGVIAAIVKFAEFIPPYYEYVRKDNNYDTMRLTEDLIPSSSSIKRDESSTVAFELDCGKNVVAPRGLMCRMSPVIEAMLNGHFSEAGKDSVKLSDCSYKAIAAMVALVRGQVSVPKLNVDINTRLELVSLCDRFLIIDLGIVLTNALILLPEIDYSAVYVWSLTAGHSQNVNRLRSNAYYMILQGRDALRAALECHETRPHIVDDISDSFTAFRRKQRFGK